MSNQASGPTVSESMSKKPLDPLQNLDGEDLKLDGGGMYPAFKAPEGEKKEENQLDNSKYMPILTGMLDSGNIDFVSYNETKDKIKKLGENGKDEVPKIISNIIDKSGLNEKTKTLLKKQLEGQNQVNEEDFESTQFAKHKDLLGLDKGIGGLELLLAENYIEIPNNKGNVDIEKDALTRTIEITLNKLLENNNQDFYTNNADLIKKVREGSGFTEKYLNLKKIHKLGLVEDAKFGGKKGQKEIAQKTKSLNSKIRDFNERFEEAKKNNAEQGNDKLIADFKKEHEEIMKEKKVKKVFEGDIFVAGKEDKSPDVKENDPFALT